MSSTTTDLETRIAAESSKLKAEEQREKTLIAARLSPLENGNDAELDRIEGEIDQSRNAQLRIQERIELLQGSFEKAQRESQREELDEIAGSAEGHRRAAEKLLRSKYSKLAKELAALLHEVQDHDTAIRRANRKLSKSGRDPVPLSNTFRIREGYTDTVVTQKSYGPRDFGHPDREFMKWNNAFSPYDSRTNTPIGPVTVDVEEERWVPHHVPPSLTGAIVLPGLLENDAQIWPPIQDRSAEANVDEEESGDADRVAVSRAA